MQRHELNIPTIYSHSIFIGDKGNQIMLTKNQFNYFWAIIYLYRNKLLHLKPDGFIPVDKNSKKRSKLNPDTIWDDKDVKINFSEIQKVIKGKNNGDQKELKNFIDLFKNLQLKTNLFGKSPADTVEKIVKPVKQVTKNFKNIELQLTKEFIIPLLITDVLFKKVALNFMFWLPTYKSKVLYLLFKDYDAFHKNFTKDEIEKMVGVIFNNARDEKILDYINKMTDIYVNKEASEFLEDTFKYTVIPQKRFVSDCEEIDYFTKKLISEEVKKKIAFENETGNQIKDEKAYSKKVFAQIINDEEEKEKFETMALIDMFIREKKELLAEKINDQYDGYMYLTKEIKSKDGTKVCVLTDQYTIREAIYPTPITDNPEKTYEKISEAKDLPINIYYSDVELADCSKSLIKLT